MRIVVLGSQGQLGRDLVPRLPGEVHPWTRANCDLGTATSLDALKSLGPTHVINCAAYNLVDQAEAEAEKAFLVNAHGVRQLAIACQEIGATFVHFSTDYVFGEPVYHQPLSETATPGPVSSYGLSKLAGEHNARIYCQKHLIIRTCGLYGVWGSGGKGGNFVETMLRVAGQGKPLRVVADQICTPSYTRDVAEMTVTLIEREARGLIHLTNSGACSWYELAAKIFELSDMRPSLTPITTAEFGAKARRPAYSVLAHDTLQTLGLSMRPWTEALAAYLEERQRKTV